MEDLVEPPQEFLCPISREIMVDPVTAADGHSYERAYITTHLAARASKSPMTNLRLPHRNLIPNVALKKAIDAYTGKQETLKASLLSTQGLMPDPSLPKQVLTLHNHIAAALTANPQDAEGNLWEPNAAATFAGSILRAIRKKRMADLLENPASEDFPKCLLPVVKDYLQANSNFTSKVSGASSQAARQLEQLLYTSDGLTELRAQVAVP